MNKLAAIRPYAPEERYDAFLAALGYERRAVFASQYLNPHATNRVACAFADRQVGAFADNKKWFASAGFNIEQVRETDAEGWTRTWLDGIVAKNSESGTIRLAVDISSMSRIRLASLLATIMRLESAAVTVDFLYSPAKWSAPSEDPEPIVSAGAVLPFFAGWSSQRELPTIVVIGLGYEPDKAVGAYEYLEASGVWAFVPESDEARYTRDVGRANESLLTQVAKNQVITYRVNQPVSCFGAIESVVYGLLSGARPVLLPFGPKIFAVCCMLVACMHRDVPIWRISSGQYGDPVEREASGSIVGIRAVFSPVATNGMED